MADEGRLVKQEKDYTKEVDAALAEATQVSSGGRVQQAVDGLMVLEKQTRLGHDVPSNTRLLVAMVQLCFRAGEWRMLMDCVSLLAKKHALLKHAVAKMVQEAVSYVDKAPDAATRLAYIDTLRTVTEGKIYVEIERARLTRILSQIKEAEGKINEAAEILQELQVETYGSMERREKTDFILEQMRLNLARKDYVRMQIISKKINTKYFEKEEVSDLKLRFYELMIQHALFHGEYLSMCKYYREVYNTKSVQDDDAKWAEILKYIVITIVLSPFDNDQSDLIHRIKTEKKLEKLPLYHGLIKAFVTDEIMRWPSMSKHYQAEMQNVFLFQSAEGVKRWEDFHHRVIEHNIRIVAKYYDRITLQRLKELLDLPLKETEQFIAKLVEKTTIYAKIDRLDGIVKFKRRKDPNELLNEWTSDVNNLLDLIAKTTHLIAKEEMVHKIGKTSV